MFDHLLFGLQGEPRCVAQAIYIITAAVDRYKELCEGRYTGEPTATMQPQYVQQSWLGHTASRCKHTHHLKHECSQQRTVHVLVNVHISPVVASTVAG